MEIGNPYSLLTFLYATNSISHPQLIKSSLPVFNDDDNVLPENPNRQYKPFTHKIVANTPCVGRTPSRAEVTSPACPVTLDVRVATLDIAGRGLVSSVVVEGA